MSRPPQHIAYAAGLLDTEGCIAIARDCCGNTPYHRLQVSVANTDLAILETLKRHYGGFICSVKRYKDGHKAGWQWYATGPTAAAFLEPAAPYLIVKAPQAALADEFMRQRQDLPHKPPADHPEMIRRDGCYERMKGLNRRGADVAFDALAMPTRGKFTRQDQKAAYLAGLVDGDGSIIIGRTNKKRRDGSVFPKHELLLVIVGTDPHLPHWLQSEFGGTAYETRTQDGWKTRSTWKVSGQAAADTLRLIGRFLRLKKAQQETALRFQDGFVRLTRGSSKKEVNAELRRRDACYDKMRLLNQRGDTAATTKPTAPEAQPGEAIV